MTKKNGKIYMQLMMIIKHQCARNCEVIL